MKHKFLINVILICLLSLAFISCKEHESKWRGTIEEQSGVTIVKNPKDPVYKEEVFRLEEELCLGEAQGPEEYMFSQLRDIAVDENGNIYLLDYKESHVKVFDKNGQYLNTIGKEGKGPGELDSPMSISINQEREEILVLEAARRMSFFSLKGKFLRNISTEKIWALRAGVNSSGYIIITEGVTDPENPRYELKILDGEMNFIRKISESPAPGPSKFNPFMPVSYWVIDSDDNIVYGYPQKYEIKKISPEGQLLKKITREYHPVKVTKEEKEEWKEGYPSSIRLDISECHSAFRRFVVNEKGRLMVQTWERIEDGEGYYYDIFNSEGKYLSKVPLRMSPRVWKNGRIYTIEEDESGFHVVKRYRVVWDIPDKIEGKG